MSKILVVDDDPHIRELVRVFLQDEGFTVYEAADGKDALAKLETLKVDMVVLDMMMPNMDGWELCRELREIYDIPVLMLTAKGETHDKIKGFQLGTDDYLVKPFEPLELVMRVKALLKRYRIATSQTVQIGELIDQHKTYEVTSMAKAHAAAQRIRTAVQARQLSRQDALARQLIEDIWGYDFEGNERTLDVHINRLRERFPEEQACVPH